MNGVFISYRREDSAGHAGRLFDRFTRVFGDDGVFMDVDDIRRGDNFADTLAERLRQCDVLLAVIGRQWLTITDAAGHRRLDNSDDWVRSEIREALTKGRLVIPVLVGGAALPTAASLPEDICTLSHRQMAEVRDASWNDDVARLCIDIKKRRARGSWSEWLRGHWLTIAITLLLALAASGYSAYIYFRNSRAAVPLVSGLSLDRATKTLKDAGLQVGQISKRATNEYPPDWVVEQNPATATVHKGAAIALTVTTPKAADLTQYITIRDVGMEATVVAAACVVAMDVSLATQGHPTMLSMRYIYEKSKRHDEVTGEGTFLETTFYVARQFGAPPESLWPYKSENRKLPPRTTWSNLDAAASRYKARISQIPTLDGVLGALDKGMVVIVGANSTDSWNSDASVKTGLIKPTAEDRLLGKTAIAIVGYDPAARRFKFANCWGTEWGDKGFGYFDSADATRILELDTGLWSVTVPPVDR